MRKVKIVNRKRFTFTLSVALIFMISMSMLFMSSLQVEGATEKEYIHIQVKTGDTLWSIAKEYCDHKTDVREVVYSIQTENKLVSSVIHPGQELQIPID